MKRNVILTAQHNPEIGYTGLVPSIFSAWENYFPVLSNGGGLAHDLMEHGTKEDGSIRMELKALGALLYVREFGSVYNQDTEIYAANTFTNEFNGLRSGTTSEDLPEPPRFSFPSYYKQQMEKFLRVVRQHLSDIDDQSDFEFFSDNWEIVAKWIRYGFASAFRRYKGEYVFNTFEAIVEAHKAFFKVKHAFDSLSFEEGEQFRLTYGDGDAHFERIERWGY